MGWLKLSFGKGGTAVAERDTAESAPEVPSGPPLIVLVNDASGRASFKEYVFQDIEAATDWVGYWFPRQSEDGMIAFWAMPDELESGSAEPLVMIRDTARQGVVYMFSFSSLAAAEQFIGGEADHGTDPDSIVLYWAVPVKREFDRFGKIFLTPSTPPDSAANDLLRGAQVDRRVDPQEQQAPETPKDDRSAPLEEASNARTGVAQPMGGAEDTFELTSWVHRSRKREFNQPEADPEPVEKTIERHVPALSIEQVIEEITLDLDEVLEDADGGAENEVLLSNDASGQAVELTFDDDTVGQPIELTVVNGTLSDPQQGEVVTTDTETLGEPFEDEVVTTVNAAFAEPLEIEEVSTSTETLAEPFEDEEVPSDSAALAEPAEADVLYGANETPAEPRDDEFKPADEPHVPDYNQPQHEVAPPAVNGNGHVHEVTSSLWKRADGIAGSVQSDVRVNGASPGEVKKTVREVVEWEATEEVDGSVDAQENGASSEEIKNRIKEVLVNVNVNVNLNDGTHSESTTNVSIVSRALKIKRWEVREEPFEGFNSPPGRF